MRNRICKTSLLSLTALFAAVSISLGQTPSEKTNPDTATLDTAKPAVTTMDAATAIVQPTEEKKTAAQPNEAEMMKQMMELAKTGENHKLLAGMVGTWSYTVKMWMDPSAPPTSSTGSAVIKSIMDGRFFVGDFTGKMQMPGADGKMKDMQFKGMSVDGYDNVKQKFVSTWCDSMGTGFMMSEGTYDPTTKTFNYTGDYEGIPGMKTKVRMTVKIIDKDHHDFEFYEDRGTGETKTMEMNYTRKK